MFSIHESRLPAAQALSIAGFLHYRGDPRSYIERRMKSGIKSFGIMPNNAVNRSYDKKNQLRNVKFDPHLKIPGQVRMYHNKVAIITFQKNHPIGFVMVGNLTYVMFKAIFDLAWKQSPKQESLHLAS